MKQRKHILIVVSVLVVAALGLGGWYLLSDRQPPELTTVATYQAECGRAVMVEELVAHGHITREQAKTYPHRNYITRALGVNATVRRRLGSDISAACGQLRLAEKG